MEWYNKLLDICSEHGFEPLKDMKDILKIVCPKIPSVIIQEKVREVIPSHFRTVFVEGPQQLHMTRIIQKAKEIGLQPLATIFLEGLMTIRALGNKDNPLIKDLEKVALDDPTINSVHIDIRESNPAFDTMMDMMNKIGPNPKDFLGFPTQEDTQPMQAIPHRITEEVQQNQKTGQHIMKNDITDLKISLGTCESVEDFLESI